MPFACKFCLAAKGLKGSEIDALPQTYEEAAEHVEREHRYPVRREGESWDEAEHRVFLAYQRPLWRAPTALERALGGPNAAAAALIESTGPILTVKGRFSLTKNPDGTYDFERCPHAQEERK
jgi:hypothetical protein